MGGGSNIAIAVQTLRQNRALLKKRKFKNLKDLLYEASGKTKLEFKKISTQELFNIKQEIRKQTKRNTRIELRILIGSFAMALLLLSAIYWWIN